MADSPNPTDVKKALTFKGATVAWAILKRHKIIESSRCAYLRAAGSRRTLAGAFMGDYSARYRIAPGRVLSQRYMGCIVGLFKIKDCRRPNNCGGSVWAEAGVMWKRSSSSFTGTVTKGKLHVWVMDEGTRLRVVAQLASLPTLYTTIFITSTEPIIGPITPGRNRSANRTDDLPSSSSSSWVDESSYLYDYGALRRYHTEGYYQRQGGATRSNAARPGAAAAHHAPFRVNHASMAWSDI